MKTTYRDENETRADRAIAKAVGACAPPTADNPGPARTVAQLADSYRRLFHREPSARTLAAWAAADALAPAPAPEERPWQPSRHSRVAGRAR